ncbi:MAG TPA: nitronate monooxygenase [Caldimonas sp.]|nr:nitronate monooxygenase [Caldimonas sp.]
MTATITSLFGIELPIVQAPMAGVQNHRLAAAVSNAGGLGSLPAALMSAEQLGTELAALQAATSRPFSVNFFCHAAPVPDAARDAAWRRALAPYYAEFGIDPSESAAAPRRQPFNADAAAIVEATRPAVVSFQFGLPEPALLARVRGAGAKIVGAATTLDEARWLEAHGVDAIVVQGLEAGGHRAMFLSRDLATQSGTFALLPQVARAVRVPVLAAGGIADADGVRAALALGAAGAWAGSAYLLCDEATTSSVHRAALLSPAAGYTALTNLYSGGVARGIVTRLMRELGPIRDAPAFPLASDALAPLRARAERNGSGDFSPLWVGQNASACKAGPAAVRTRELAGVA